MLVSVIVPVYKAEKWLHRCVDSILAQTMTDFELLLIDDGSPDRSGEICDEYAAKDSRVRVFHKENGGVSSARQMGLENVFGDYVIHCDPDDWVEPKMLMELTQYAKKTQVDMVICDFYKENAKGEDLEYIKQALCPIEKSHDVLVKIVNQKIHGSCWNKLVRRNVLNGISFYPEDLNLAEDELFNIKVLKSNIKVGYLNEAFYHYVQHDESITHKKNLRISLYRIKEIDELEKLLDKSLFDDFYVLKSSILLDLFRLNRIKEFYGLYSDIYPRIIATRKKYNFKLPLRYFFIMALDGYPRIAYYLCELNLVFISLFKKLKKKKNMFFYK